MRGDALQVRNKNLKPKDIILGQIKIYDYIVMTYDAKILIDILFVKFKSNKIFKTMFWKFC